MRQEVFLFITFELQNSIRKYIYHKFEFLTLIEYIKY